MRLPRFVERIRAGLGGYFWIPCPVCGRHFGGHEEPYGVMDRGRSGRGCLYCADCVIRYGDHILVPDVVFDLAKNMHVPLSLTNPELLPTSISAPTNSGQEVTAND